MSDLSSPLESQRTKNESNAATPLQDEASKLRMPELPRLPAIPSITTPLIQGEFKPYSTIPPAVAEFKPLNPIQRLAAANRYATQALAGKAFSDADTNENFFLSKRELENAAKATAGSMPQDAANYFNLKFDTVKDLVWDRYPGRTNPHPVRFNELGLTRQDLHALNVATMADPSARAQAINEMTLTSHWGTGAIVGGAGVGLVGGAIGGLAKGWRGALVGVGIGVVGGGFGLMLVRDSLTEKLNKVRRTVEGDTTIDRIESRK